MMEMNSKKESCFQNENNYIISFLLMVLAGNYISQIFYIFAIVIVVVEVMLCDEEFNFAFSFFLIPNIRIFDGIGVTWIVNMLMILPFIKYIIFRNFKIRKDIISFSLFLASFILLHIILQNDIAEVISNSVWVINFVYCFSLILDKKINLRIDKINNCLISGVIGSAMVYLFSNLTYMQTLIPKIMSGTRFQAYAHDPNYYSIYICISLCILLQGKNHKFFDYLTVILLMVIELLTASKMGFLLMMGILACNFMGVVFETRREFKFKKRFLIVVLLIICVVAFFMQDLLIQFLDNFIKRLRVTNLNNIDLNAMTSGRTEIQNGYINLIFTDWKVLLTGYGFGYYKTLGIVHGIKHLAHNTYLDLVLSWGIIGLIGVVYLMGYYFVKFRQNWKCDTKFTSYLPLIVLLLSYTSLSCFSAGMFWWIIAIVVLSFKTE